MHHAPFRKFQLIVKQKNNNLKFTYANRVCHVPFRVIITY